MLCINDSKATSFDACLQSLSNYNKIYWIVGGLPKYKDYFYLKSVKKKLSKHILLEKIFHFLKSKLEK